MEFRIESQGPTLAQLTAKSARALRTANRAAGRAIAKDGKKAMEGVAKGTGRRWYGRPLRVKFKVDSSPTKALVTFNPARGQAGGWAIADTGASAHLIRPRNRKALLIAGRYAAAAHHPGTRGAGAWSKAGKSLDKAIRPELVDIYGEALSGG